MNALSALRTLAYPALRTEPSAEPAGLKTIPFADLEKITPSFAPQLPGGAQAVGGSFENMVTGLVGEVAAKQAVAGEAVQGLLAGQNVSLHQTMIAMEEASVSFQLMVEVRNKMLESYQELMRMQV